jgi:hypothetical protein
VAAEDPHAVGLTSASGPLTTVTSSPMSATASRRSATGPPTIGASPGRQLLCPLLGSHMTSARPSL